MANFSPADFNVEDINLGQKYEDGNIVNATAINAPIEAVLLMKTLFTNTPEVVENGGTPSVAIVQEGDNFKLVFSNLKGDKGDKGDTGDRGQTGATGATPQKGEDYFTADDKAEIVTEVLAALPNAEDNVF